jgi:hypothetical protein
MMAANNHKLCNDAGVWALIVRAFRLIARNDIFRMCYFKE